MSAIDHLRVLVVEDQKLQRTLLSTMLSGLGAKTVYEAAGGREALALIEDEQHPVDIIITDLDMPEMDGLELVRRVSEQQANRASVILVTAMESKLLASVGAMTKAYGLPLLGVLEKPLTPGKLAPLIQHYRPVQVHPSPAKSELAFTVEEILDGLSRGEFEPFFQPQIDALSGRVVAAEALARWRHPDHGLVSPASFVPTLERAGQLDILTFVMLREAAQACRSWRGRGLDLTVSVNLSLVSLSDTTLADRIADIVATEGLHVGQMMLEITESAAMTEVAPALENLARLRMRGFGLAVDDYGTGFSTLRQLTRVPFTELKIDRSFVKGCAQSELSRAMVDSSIDMARRLEIKSVAEGIETPAQWAALRSAGCNAGQGYLFARPMPAGEFAGYCLSL